MIVKGYVVNRTGKCKFIFQRSVVPNQRVPLKDLYELYELKCGCAFDEKFIAWLLENKVPKEDWELDGLETAFDEPVKVVSGVVSVSPSAPKNFSAVDEIDIKARDIAGLKIKDKPRSVLNRINSITKLRRALTFTNKKKGKSFLTKLIKARVDKLLKEQENTEG